MVPTTSFDGKETTEVIGWQGMVIQNTYASAKEQVQKQVPEGVYLSCCLYGSPAQASLMPGIWITEVDQTPVKTLQEFLQVVDPSNIAARQSKKLKQQKKDQDVFKKQQDGHAASLLALPTQDEIDDDKLSHDDNHIQIKFVKANNVVQVKAIKLDRHYWPTWHIKKNESSVLGWDMTFL